MAKLILNRLLLGVLTLFAVSVLIFVCTQILPGDVASAVLGQGATPEALVLFRKELGLSYILITHDLDVVHRIAHRTAVMLQGQFVAFDATDKIFDHPDHPYTRKLITAVPEMRVDWLDEVLARRKAEQAA